MSTVNASRRAVSAPVEVEHAPPMTLFLPSKGRLRQMASVARRLSITSSSRIGTFSRCELVAKAWLWRPIAARGSAAAARKTPSRGLVRGPRKGARQQEVGGWDAATQSRWLGVGDGHADMKINRGPEVMWPGTPLVQAAAYETHRFRAQRHTLLPLGLPRDAACKDASTFSFQPHERPFSPPPRRFQFWVPRHFSTPTRHQEPPRSSAVDRSRIAGQTVAGVGAVKPGRSERPSTLHAGIDLQRCCLRLCFSPRFCLAIAAFASRQTHQGDPLLSFHLLRRNAGNIAAPPLEFHYRWL